MDSAGWILMTAAGAICAGLLLFSLLSSFFVAIPPEGFPDRREIRRCMFLGLYCNPRDPRVLVPRPTGSGWTINFRSESLVMLFFIMLVVILIAVLLVIYAALP